MKKFQKKSIVTVMVAFFVFAVLGLVMPSATLAASPSLGAAASYGILGGTYNNTNPTTINGDVGYTTGPGALGDIVGHPSVPYPT